jgi:hypothetical protein
MSKSAELLFRLSEEGYVSRRIPGSRDTEIADFLNQVCAADVFAGISRDLNAATAWILLAFADRAASYAVRIRDVTWARHGVMAAQLASTKIDPREALVVYSILYRAIELLDGDPISTFRGVASRAPIEIGEFTIAFALRDDEDKSIDAMGYVEGADDDGFAFLRTW